MYKFFKSMLFMALLLMSWTMQAQTHYRLQVGNGTETNSYLPNYTYYNYAYSQMLYSAGDIGIDGTIDTLAFQASSGGATRSLTIYLAEVGQASLTSQVAETQFYQVFSGSVTWASGWTYIPLDTTFSYQGSGSLVVAVIDNTGSYVTSQIFLGSTMSEPRSKYIYSDYDTYTLSSLMNSTTNFLPNMMVCINSNTSYCPAPTNFVVSNINFDSAHFSWTESGSSTSWELVLSDTVVTDFDDVNIIPVTDTQYTVTGLDGNTLYYAYVRAYCDAASSSAWRATSFRSACMGYTNIPYVTGFEDADNLPNCWQAFATGSSSAGTFPSVYEYALNARNGMKYFEFESTTGQTEIAALPQMQNISNLQLEFHAACMINNMLFEVGVIEDSVFVPIDTVALTIGIADNWHNSYYPYTVYFDEYDGNSEYMAMRVSGVGSYTLMIDDISVSEIPNCRPPSHFHVAGLGTDWVTLAWDDENSYGWEILYDTVAFNPNNTSRTPYSSSDLQATITDLVTGAEYIAYLRGNCGSDDSPWIGPLTFVPGVFTMSYTGTDTLIGCGFTIYDDGGLTGAYNAGANSMVVVYPSTEDSLVVFSGSADVYSYVGYLRIYDGVGTDGALLWESGNNNSTIPATTSHVGPITIHFNAGPYNYGYGGFVINTSCTAAPHCAMVQNLQASEVGTASAYLNWEVTGLNLGTPTGYEVSCYDTTGVQVFLNTITSTGVIVSGLTPNESYMALVRTVCENGDHGEYDTVEFNTLSLGCAVVDLNSSAFDTIGTGTASYSNIPSYSFYNYSWTQQIYTAAEIGQGGTITSISVMPITVNTQRTLEIYLAHTSASTFTDFMHPSDLTLVYNGAPNTLTANQWAEFTLDQPFHYNGSDNLLVCFRDMTGSYATANTWAVHTTTNNMAGYIYRDDSPYDPYTINGANTTNNRNNIAITMMACSQLASCAPPVVVVDSIATDAINVIWGAGYMETSWVVEHRADDDSTWTVDGTTSNDSWLFTNLDVNELYHFRIGSVCSDTVMYTTVSARTKCGGENLPFIYGFENFPSTGYPSCWYKATTYTYFETPAPSQSDAHSGTTSLYMYCSSGTYSYVVLPELNAELDTIAMNFWMLSPYSGYPNELYVGVMTDAENFSTFQRVATVGSTQINVWEPFTVRFNNYNGNGTRIAIVAPQSDNVNSYIDDINISFVSPCAGVENVHLDDVTSTSATITWNGGDNSNFDVVYLLSGGSIDTGNYVSVTEDSITITGLTANTQYDVYVRSICSSGDTSNWSNALSFRTECVMIATVPYTEGFENNVAGWSSSNNANFYPCWYRHNYSSNGYYEPYVQTYTTHTGNAAIYWVWDSYNGYDPFVVMPAFDTNAIDLSMMQLSFWAMNGSSYADIPMIYVGTMTNPQALNTFQGLDTILLTDMAWTKYEIPLSAYNGHGEYIAILSGNTGDYWYAYIDDFTIDSIPSCQHVYDLALTGNTSSSVSLSWTEVGSATTWEIAVDTVATATPVADTIVTGTSAATIGNLNSGTSYYFWVRSVCSATEASAWEGPVMGIPGSWFMRANQTDTLHMCGGVITDDGGPTGDYSSNQDSYIILYPDAPGNLVSVSGNVIIEGSSWDNLYVYDGVGTTGTELVALVGSSYTGGTTITATSTSGPLTIRFKSDASMNYPGFALNVSCITTSCLVMNLALDEDFPASSNSLALTWDAVAGSTGYDVEYGTPGFTVGTGAQLSSSTNSIVISGLNAMSNYEVYVRSICQGNDTGSWAHGIFSTSMCDDVNEIQSWDSTMSTTTSIYGPIGYCLYNYSYVQTLIDSARFADLSDPISAFAFKPDNTTSSNYYEHMTVWMANVPESSLASGIIYPDDSTHIFVPVIVDADFGFNDTEWQLHSFDTTFTWDGHSNVLFVVKRDHGSWASSGSFAAHNTVDVMTQYLYTDDASITPGGTGYVSSGSGSYVGDLKFFSCGSGCSAPNGLTATNVDYQGATLYWNSSAASFEIAVKAASEPTWPAETVVNSNSYEVNGLVPSTTYQFRVRAICDAAEGMISDWRVGTFTTDSLPCFAPSNVELEAATVNSATISWTSNGNEESWRIHVWNTVFDQTYDVTSNPATITGLSQTVTYNATVSALCGGIVESDPSDTLVFTTATCQPATEVTVTNITGTTAVVNWNGSANSYNIEYGPMGFGAGDGTTINAISNTTYTITDLEPEMQYDVYVYANCDGQLSVASSVVHFTTTAGISNVTGSNISIYPNPATSATVVSLTGIHGDVTLTIVDMNGRTVRTVTMGCEGDCSKRVEVDGLAQGAYFVRISGDSINAVKKLVVK